ncbi:tRNA (adenosine(37)-N6)-threonylcarbamoyltransferase complex dimerization subunit type 1 TsaB, partial [PVC group bacterium]|nr:tRNA (adenosine(37)-N6)-threonylcarbamoyltransferase complex dimerization subunit type 1 TsaB [PVC group bacterium]
MKILALETSSSCVNVGLCLDSGMIFEESLLNRGSQFILGAVDKLLKDARIKLDDVDVFGVSVGPGSFTGLRVGLSFAKGFSYSCRRPLVAVESLKVWAFPFCRKSTNIVVLLDAKRTCVYGQAFLCQ